MFLHKVLAKEGKPKVILFVYDEAFRTGRENVLICINDEQRLVHFHVLHNVYAHVCDLLHVSIILLLLAIIRQQQLHAKLDSQFHENQFASSHFSKR